MPQWKNIDINNYFEFKIAEYIISNKKLQNEKVYFITDGVVDRNRNWGSKIRLNC